MVDRDDAAETSALFARRLSTSAYDPHALLHSSRIPTSHFQDSRPKLGVPKLEDTLKRFLYSRSRWCRRRRSRRRRRSPPSSARARAPRCRRARRGRRGEIQQLHAGAVVRHGLRDRRPLLLNHNPQLTFKDEPSAERATQVERAARLVHASATFLRTLEAGVLAPDVFHTNPEAVEDAVVARGDAAAAATRRSFYGAAATGAYPLDMSQYANLPSGRRRLPRAGRDELVVAAGTRQDRRAARRSCLEGARPRRRRRKPSSRGSTPRCRPSSTPPTPPPPARPPPTASGCSPPRVAMSGRRCERRSRRRRRRPRRSPRSTARSSW